MIKLIEIPKEELLEKFKEGIINEEYLIDYIVMINKTYNKLIERCTELENKLEVLDKKESEVN